MLAGIVAMQVEVLKLEAGIGRSMQRASQLQTRNDALRASVAALADDQRIENLAARMGMVMPPSPEVGFLQHGNPGDGGKAIANIHAPNPTTFLSALSADAAAAQAATTQSASAQSGSAQGGSAQGSAAQADAGSTPQSNYPQPSSPPGG
jgi:hypothetical protein